MSVSYEIVREAQKRLKQFSMNTKSIKETSLHGFIAELMFEKYTHGSLYVNDLEYDFLLDGMRLEIKTTNTKMLGPSKYYQYGTVWDYQINFKRDFVIFTEVNKDCSMFYMAGFIPWDYFQVNSKRLVRGSINPVIPFNPNVKLNHKCKETFRYLEYGDLYCIKLLRPMIRGCNSVLRNKEIHYETDKEKGRFTFT